MSYFTRAICLCSSVSAWNARLCVFDFLMIQLRRLVASNPHAAPRFKIPSRFLWSGVGLFLVPWLNRNWTETLRVNWRLTLIIDLCNFGDDAALNVNISSFKTQIWHEDPVTCSMRWVLHKLAVTVAVCFLAWRLSLTSGFDWRQE